MNLKKALIVIPENLPNYSNTCLSPGTAMARWAKTKQLQKESMLRLRPRILNFKLPVKIILIRISPRKLDHDNLIHAFKHIKDGVSQLFYPLLPLGKADDYDDFEWIYKQEQEGPKKYAIRIEVEEK